MIDLEVRPKVAITACLDDGSDDAEASLSELSLLLSNLKIRTVASAVQRRRSPDPATYLGQGKALEIKEHAAACGANLLAVDGFLSPTQRSGLGKLTGLEIWDRAFAIMLIFEQRATSAEAKLQVELAMLKYEIPSLKGLGHQMSRLGGGIGTRGPGETEFERHRRKLERRIKFIERDLESARRRRERTRARRWRGGDPSVSLVGYTNAGKSTILRALSHDISIVAEDKIFQTLDTVTRRIARPEGGAFMLSDTVGFIRNLPPELVAAFRATLEETADASLLVLVLDASSPEPMRGYEIVRDTLAEIGAGDVPRIVALNKIDAAPEEAIFTAAGIASLGEDVARVSAVTGEGMDELVDLISRRVRA